MDREVPRIPRGDGAEAQSEGLGHPRGGHPRGAREALPEENQDKVPGWSIARHHAHPSGQWQHAQHGRPQRPHAPPPGTDGKKGEIIERCGYSRGCSTGCRCFGVSSIGAYGVNPRDVVGDPLRLAPVKSEWKLTSSRNEYWDPCNVHKIIREQRQTHLNQKVRREELS